MSLVDFSSWIRLRIGGEIGGKWTTLRQDVGWIELDWSSSRKISAKIGEIPTSSARLAKISIFYRTETSLIDFSSSIRLRIGGEIGGKWTTLRQNVGWIELDWNWSGKSVGKCQLMEPQQLSAWNWMEMKRNNNNNSNNNKREKERKKERERERERERESKGHGMVTRTCLRKGLRQGEFVALPWTCGPVACVTHGRQATVDRARRLGRSVNFIGGRLLGQRRPRVQRGWPFTFTFADFGHDHQHQHKQKESNNWTQPAGWYMQMSTHWRGALGEEEEQQLEQFVWNSRVKVRRWSKPSVATTERSM